MKKIIAEKCIEMYNKSGANGYRIYENYGISVKTVCFDMENKIGIYVANDVDGMYHIAIDGTVDEITGEYKLYVFKLLSEEVEE